MNQIGSLANVEIALVGTGDEAVHPDHAHAVLCQWFDRDRHGALRKPFTLRELTAADDGVHLSVSTVSTEALHDLHDGLARTTSVRLGRSQYRVESALVTRNTDWAELLDEAIPAAWIDLVLETPTAFRSQGSVSVMPMPGLVFGHLRAVWEHWAPDGLRPTIDLSAVPIRAGYLEGRTETVRARHRTWPGFRGSVGFDLTDADERERRVLCALALLAPFAGVGANTTVGMGAASVRVHERVPSPGSAPAHGQRSSRMPQQRQKGRR